MPRTMLCTVRAQTERSGGGTRQEHNGGVSATRGTAGGASALQIAMHCALSDGRGKGTEESRRKRVRSLAREGSQGPQRAEEANKG